jgi:putative CocE/NonD family hydrolase
MPVAPAVRLDWATKIILRDGVTLNATVYQPRGVEGKRPAILTITPYIADGFHDTGMFFASHGYAFVVVDSRGRGNSEGVFEPYSVQDGLDGHDIVEWITRQPWSNGKVGMWGGSYAGFNQWATLKEFPKGLVTIVPVASGFPGFDNPPFYKNIFSVWSVNWAASVLGRTHNTRTTNDIDYWTAVARTHFIAQRPFTDFEDELGIPLPAVRRWLAHPMLDAYYDAMVPNPAAYSAFDLPILTITGQFDGVQRGALRYHNLHMQYGSAAGRAKHYLIIGPWNHAGTRKPVPEVGGLHVGEPSLIDMNQLLLEWYDWTMRAGSRPGFLGQRVAYYITGSEEWRYARELDQLGAAPQRLFLGRPAQGLEGSLLGHTPVESHRSYDYNPRDTRSGEHEPAYGPRYLLDDSAVTNLQGAGLVYETQPLQESRLVAGRPKAVLWLEVNVPDTDIELILYEVRPDGTSLRLTQDWMRLRYRDSLSHATLMPRNHLVRCEWTDFAFFARRIAPGSRLRLLIHAPNSIYTEKNYNSGGEVSRESGAVARVARITLQQGGEHASFLELPIITK